MLNREDIVGQAKDFKKELWLSATLGALMTGHLGFLIIALIIYSGYIDSKNVAFDSPKLDHQDDIIKIRPFERGF